MLSKLLKATKSLRSLPVFQKLGEAHTSNMGYRAMGLRFDDLVPTDQDVCVPEALRRLSEQEAHARLFRIRRAFALSVKKMTLDKYDATDVNY
jgi:hypothetical protein